jgi:hypothetical protein
VQNARHFRDKAALCLKIAQYLSDPKAAESLRESAAQNFARAEELEKRTRDAEQGAPAVSAVTALPDDDRASEG